MYLLNLVLIEFAEIVVIIQFIASAIVLDKALDGHAVVYDQKAAFYLDGSDSRQIEQGILYIRRRNRRRKDGKRIFISLLQSEYGKFDRHGIAFRSLNTAVRHTRLHGHPFIQIISNEYRQFLPCPHPFFQFIFLGKASGLIVIL